MTSKVKSKHRNEALRSWEKNFNGTERDYKIFVTAYNMGFKDGVRVGKYKNDKIKINGL